MKRYGSSMLLLAALLLGAPTSPAAQQAPAVDPAEVATIDGILDALYDVISGPVGQPRDWDRMRALFLPEARLIPTGPAPTGGRRARALTVEDYIRDVGPRLEAMGFHEREIARRTEQWGNIAHAWSTYDGRTAEAPDTPLLGINSIQLFHDGQRWWVANIFWEAEREGNRVPESYLR